jgi:DNA-nicking Smr family endonuclease
VTSVAKKKKVPGLEPDENAPPPPPPPVNTSLKGMLSNVKLEKAAPPAKKKDFALGKPKPPTLREQFPPAGKAVAPRPTMPDPIRPSAKLVGHDRTAFYDAMAGVRQVGSAQPARHAPIKLPAARDSAPIVREADREARARLAALVSGGLRFEVRREDDWIAGLREDAPRGTLEALSGAKVMPEARLDLHGKRAADVDQAVTRFVREKHRAGLRRVLIVHGKGLHSDAGGPVLGEQVIESLTKGGAASLTLAFVTAPDGLGGAGALLVELTRK